MLLDRSNNFAEFNQIELFNSSIDNAQTNSEDHTSSIVVEEDTFKKLFSSTGRRALFAGCFVHIFHQLTGVNMILMYAYYHELSSKSLNITNLRLIMTLLTFLTTLLSMYLCQICGRRPMMMIGFIIS